MDFLQTCQRRLTNNSKAETESEAPGMYTSGRGGPEGGPGHIDFWAVLISGPPTLV